MSRVLRILVPLLVACSNRPADPAMVQATIDGNVFVTGPVAGVVVSAYALDLDDGSQGGLIAQSMPTDDSGAYHLDLGSTHGPLVLVAHGVNGTYVEPATGVMAHWDMGTTMRAAFVGRDAGGGLRLELETGEQATAVLSPWSDWAYAESIGRLQARRDPTYSDALTHAVERFRDHTELDFSSVVPASMASGPVGSWNDTVQAGVLLAALSALTADMASASQLSPAGLGSFTLVAAVREDLGDAVLDGTGPRGRLTVGTCSVVCVLRPLTLRADLRDAGVAFLGSSANMSGITAADAAAFLGRIASRVSDLWPAPTTPTVSIAASSFQDDDGVVASVDGPAPGVATYQGDGKTVAFAAGVAPTFVKFASRYAADAPNLPEWHFTVADNHSGDDELTLSARLSRQGAQGQAVLLKDWFTVPPATGNGYNRALVISSALHADVALVGGTYTLEFRAADALGDVTTVDCAHGIGCVSWTQTILPPPLRQRPSDADACADAAIPTGHALGTGGPCPTLDNTASVNVDGPDDRKIAEGTIDNPNAMPVQVVLSASAPSTIRRGLRFMNVRVGDPASVNRGCDQAALGPVTPTGACFDPQPDSAEYGTVDVLDQDLVSGVSVLGAKALGVDAAGRQIYELAPNSTATVWLESHPWSFLMPWAPTDYVTLGPLQKVTGYTGSDWLKCVREVLSRYGDGDLSCVDQVLMREFTQLTRVTVHPQSSVTLTARPCGSDEATWAPATGTNVAAFEYTDFAWDTKASGT
jgi:hypothetical protein